MTWGVSFDNSFHYRSVIGKLNYLEKNTRPDISFAIHQCTCFSANPKQSHAMAVRCIAGYLASTKDKGIMMIPNSRKSFECYINASLAGDWKQQSAADDPSTARSRTGYLITFMDCPLVWASDRDYSFDYGGRIHCTFNSSKRNSPHVNDG